MHILIIWLILSIVAGIIASNKGRSGLGFFLLAIFLSPLIGIIIALVVESDDENVENNQLSSGTSKKCPHCAELVKIEAVICKHCRSELPVKENDDFDKLFKKTMTELLPNETVEQDENK